MEPILVLDKKEELDLDRLTNDYEKFLEPSALNKFTSLAKKTINDVTPTMVKDIAKSGMDSITQADLWKQVMQMAGEGFILLQGVSSKYTINENEIIKKFQKQ